MKYHEQVPELVHIMKTRGGFLDWRVGYDEIVTPQVLRRYVTLRLLAKHGNGMLNHQLFLIVPSR
jgi:hypothetical protein